jgi:hypothetical protein
MSRFRIFDLNPAHLQALEHKQGHESLNRGENVKELLRALAKYQKRTGQGLQGFLDEVSLDQRISRGSVRNWLNRRGTKQMEAEKEITLRQV